MHQTQIQKENEFDFGVSMIVHNREEIRDEIDFDSIEIKNEYLLGNPKHTPFIGDQDESTEIDSIVNSISSEDNLTGNPIREEETDTDEILKILNRGSDSNKYARPLSKSNPNFYASKTISLKGRVITSNPVLSNFDIINSPVRPRPVPLRVSSNPFMKYIQGKTNENLTLNVL